MPLRPESLDHIRRHLNNEIDEEIRKDREKTIEFIDRKIDKLKDEAHDIDMGGGNSTMSHATINALNDVRVRLREGK